MTTPGRHPRHGLDEVIHAPVRLSLVASLAATDKADFRFLRDTLEVSDSLLSKHLTTLEAAGYVEITKGRSGRRPRTWCRLTAKGHAAFRDHVAVLSQIVHDETLADGELRDARGR